MDGERLAGLIEAVELGDIRMFEVHGRVKQAEGVGEDVDLDLSYDTTVVPSNDRFAVFIRATLDYEEANLKATVAAVYTLSEPREDLDDELLDEFSQRVAAFQLLPFVREAFMTTAARLQTAAPVLPVWKFGPNDILRGRADPDHDGS